MKLKLLLTTALIFIFLISNVYAFGISMPYWNDNPLRVGPGDKKVVTISLQDTSGQDVGADLKLKSGSNIAKVISHDISKPILIKGGNTPVEIEINVPQLAAVGDTWRIELSARTGTLKGEGMIQLSNSVTRYFDVIVGYPEPKKEEPVAKPPTGLATRLGELGSPLNLIIGIAVIALFTGLYLLGRRKQKPVEKQEEQKSTDKAAKIVKKKV